MKPAPLAAPLAALALINEQMSARDTFTVWLFWRRDQTNNQEQIEEVYLTPERACRAATEWISNFYYEESKHDPEDGWEPPRSKLAIDDWFNAHGEDWNGGIWELEANITLT